MNTILKWLDHHHWLWLIIISPFLVFPNSNRSLAMLVIPALWILNLWVSRQENIIENGKLKIENSINKIEDSTLKIENSTEKTAAPDFKKGFPTTPMNLSLLLLSLMLLISLWATYDINLSLEKISGVVLGLGVFFAVVRESKRPLGWWLSLVAFLVGGLGWALIGFLGTNWQMRFNFLVPFVSRIPNLISGVPGLETGLQHNAVGGTLLWILPLFLTLSVYASKPSTSSNSYLIVLPKTFRGTRAKWALRLLLWLSTLFIISVLILTQSRGTYLTFGITVIVMLLIVLPVRWRWRLLLGLVSTAVLLAVFLFQSDGWEGFISLLGLKEQAGFSLDSLASRLEIWPRAIDGVQDFPFTGMGMNTFREIVHILYPLFSISPDIDIAHAHNEFLQAALDLGIPGLIAFISIYIIAFWMLIKIWKSTNESFLTSAPLAGEGRVQLNLQQVMALGLGGGLFGHMLFGMIDAISLGAKPGIFYWMLLGLIVGMYEELKIED